MNFLKQVAAHVLPRVGRGASQLRYLSTFIALALMIAPVSPGVAQSVQPQIEEVAMLPPDFASPLIVGGRDVNQRRWASNYQWQVAVTFRGEQFCGGTLIRKSWVLTAAHCVDWAAAGKLRVLTGTRRLDAGGESVAVTQIILHPQFDAWTLDNDIALLRLAVPVNDLDIIPTATLAQERQLASAGERAHILGWGDLIEGANNGSDILQWAAVPITSRRYCRNAFGASSVTINMMCAGQRSGEVDACQGDSGGPMVVRDGDGNWVQVGITSWGIGCARAGFPGVYTRLSRYGGWIRTTIRANRS